MSGISILLSVIALLTAIPIGWVLAWLCKEELVIGRKWFKIIMVFFSVVFLLGLVFFRDFSILLSISYMIIVTYVSLYKSNDKNFVKIN